MLQNKSLNKKINSNILYSIKLCLNKDLNKIVLFMSL